MIVPTRVIQHPDERQEIVRVLNPPLLEEWDPNDGLAFETSIIWLVARESLDFVRVANVMRAASRRDPLSMAGASVLGYSLLTPDAPVHPRTQSFTRRVFYWLPEDQFRNLNDAPAGSVDAMSVLPGYAGDPPDTRQFARAYPRTRRRVQRAKLGRPVPIQYQLAAHLSRDGRTD